MGKLYKVLGQDTPAVNTDVILYTVPALTNTVISTISVTSLEALNTTSHRIAIVPSGQTLANKHYIRYDKLLEAKTEIFMSLGITLAPGDRVYIRSTSSSVAFSCFGVEIT